MYDCPDPDCDRSFGSENGAVMHYLNKPTHTKYTNKREVYDALHGAESSPEPSSDEESSASEVETQEAEPVSDGGGGTKLDLSKLGGGDDSEPEPDGCPSCGEEDYYGATEFLHHYEAKLSAEERSALESSERVCVDCGEVYG